MVKKSFLKGFSAKNAVRNDFRTAKHLFRICSACRMVKLRREPPNASGNSAHPT
jgi:hypothetical protein